VDRRVFLATLTGGLLAAPLAAKTRENAQVHRIGVLDLEGIAESAANLSAFRQGMRALGYVEGQSLIIEYRSSDVRAGRFSDLARELARLEVDVIVTRGTPAALAAKRATGTIPIVMVSSGNPSGTSTLAGYLRPGANLTGLHSTAPPEVGGTRLQLLKEMLPDLSRVGVLWNPADLHTQLVLRETKKAASAMGVQLESFEVRNAYGALPRPSDRCWYFDPAFEAAALGSVDALITVEDYVTVMCRTQIVDFAAMSRLPAIHGLREFVDAGGLMAYGTDRQDLFRRAATYVDKILKGANPGDLPVDQPTKFELAINLKTAKALGLTIPQSILQRADQVIE